MRSAPTARRAAASRHWRPAPVWRPNRGVHDRAERLQASASLGPEASAGGVYPPVPGAWREEPRGAWRPPVV